MKQWLHSAGKAALHATVVKLFAKLFNTIGTFSITNSIQ